MSRPFLHLWGWPVALGLLTASGLVTGLVSDGWGDVWAWVGLAAPVVAITWVFWPYRPSQAPSGGTSQTSRNIQSNHASALIPRAQKAIESIATLRWLRVLQRVFAALPGGYLFTAAQVALLTIALELAGLVDDTGCGDGSGSHGDATHHGARAEDWD